MACRRRRRRLWNKYSWLLCDLGVLCVSLQVAGQPQDLTQRTQRAQRKEITLPGHGPDKPCPRNITARRRRLWNKDSCLLCGLGVLCVSLLAVTSQGQRQDLTPRT